MSIQHHSPEDFERQQRFISEMLGTAKRQWPNGRLSGDDDGESAFAIAADPANKIIRIRFTKPMEWIGLDIASAKAMRQLLESKIAELEGVIPAP